MSNGNRAQENKINSGATNTYDHSTRLKVLNILQQLSDAAFGLLFIPFGENYNDVLHFEKFATFDKNKPIFSVPYGL